MKLSYQIILGLFAIFIIGIFGWAIFSPKPELSDRIYRTLQEQEKRADLAFKDVSFEEVVAGVKYWQLTAQNASVNNSTRLATLREASGTFFKQGKPVLRFRSPAALWDMKEREIILDKPLGYDVQLDRRINSLVAELRRSRLSVFNLPELYQKGLGYWFQANNLSWKLADEKLICTGGIVLNKGELTGYADRLEGDVALERISLRGNPRFVIAPRDAAPVTLEAAELELVSASDEVTARGAPRISWLSATITADRMTYDQRTKVLRLFDRVRVTYGDLQATGDSAEYLTREQKVVLKGAARARQGDNSLTGEQVVVSLPSRSISVAGRGKVVITEEELK